MAMFVVNQNYQNYSFLNSNKLHFNSLPIFANNTSTKKHNALCHANANLIATKMQLSSLWESSGLLTSHHYRLI